MLPARRRSAPTIPKQARCRQAGFVPVVEMAIRPPPCHRSRLDPNSDRRFSFGEAGKLTYVLIFFLILVAIAPLTWLKTSPGQAKKAAFRRRGVELGLKVRLAPEVTADEGDKLPTAATYAVQFLGERGEELKRSLGVWTLLRGADRGWPSDWSGWQWFRRQGGDRFYPALERVLAALPPQAYALRSGRDGVAVFLEERGDVAAVDAVASALADFLVEAEAALGRAGTNFS